LCKSGNQGINHACVPKTSLKGVESKTINGLDSKHKLNIITFDHRAIADESIGNQGIIIFSNYIMDWRTRTNAQQRAVWEDFFSSAEWRRQCPEGEIDENRIILDCFEVAPKIKKTEESEYIETQMLKYVKNKTDADGVLITLCLEQSLSEPDAIENQYKVIEEIRKAGYKWLIDARVCFEYWGKTYNSDYYNDMDEMESEQKLVVNGNYKWNPHIHICCKRIGKESVIRQNLIRKFVNKKMHGVYRIDVKRLMFAKGLDYVMGVKCEGKLEQVKMDNDTREKYGVEGTISI
jgi:hypothetical protein